MPRVRAMPGAVEVFPMLRFVAVGAEKLPVAAIGRVVIVIAIPMMDFEQLQICPREFAGAAAANPRIELERLLAIPLLARLAIASRFRDDAIELCFIGLRFSCRHFRLPESKKGLPQDLQSIRNPTQNLTICSFPVPLPVSASFSSTSMKSKLFHPAVCLICAGWISLGAAGASGSAAQPLSQEEKVLASDYIVTGTVIRILCREYDPAHHRVLDVEDARCNDSWSKSTDWVIEAENLLCRKRPPDPHVLLRITPSTQLRTVGRQRRHYAGKKMIFFLRRALVSMRDGSTVEALRFAKGRRTVFPQPLSTLERLLPALNKHCPY